MLHKKSRHKRTPLGCLEFLGSEGGPFPPPAHLDNRTADGEISDRLVPTLTHTLNHSRHEHKRFCKCKHMVSNCVCVSVCASWGHRDLSIEEEFEEGRKKNASDDELFQPYQDKRLTLLLDHRIFLTCTGMRSTRVRHHSQLSEA